MANDRILYLIVGRTGSGKSTLEKKLVEHGFRTVKSYATRPPRTPDEDTHIFISDEVADELIPNAVAQTQIGKYRYFATQEQIEDADVYVIDPNGVYEICQKVTDRAIHIIRVIADDNARRAHAIAREADKEAAAKTFDERQKAEDERFANFDKNFGDADAFPNVLVFHNVFNTYQDADLELEAKRIVNQQQLHLNLVKIVKQAAQRGFLTENEKGIAIVTASEDIAYVNPSYVADILTDDDEAYIDIMNWWLSQPDVDTYKSFIADESKLPKEQKR